MILLINGLLVFQTSLKLIVICFCKIIFKLPFFFKVCFNVFKDVQLTEFFITVLKNIVTIFTIVPVEFVCVHNRGQKQVVAHSCLNCV